MKLQYKSIAVVDDEEDIIMGFKLILQENGYDVIGFSNPLMALDYIRKHPGIFDLIIIIHDLYYEHIIFQSIVYVIWI